MSDKKIENTQVRLRDMENRSDIIGALNERREMNQRQYLKNNS